MPFFCSRKTAMGGSPKVPPSGSCLFLVPSRTKAECVVCPGTRWSMKPIPGTAAVMCVNQSRKSSSVIFRRQVRSPRFPGTRWKYSWSMRLIRRISESGIVPLGSRMVLFSK